jgi:hypothetical protein
MRTEGRRCERVWLYAHIERGYKKKWCRICIRIVSGEKRKGW